jgi:hypothetical protein
MGTTRAFSVRRYESATGRRLRSALLVASKAAPQWSENGQCHDLSNMSYFYNALFL